MTPERWQEVKAALAEALDLPDAERAAFLADIAARDPALHAELESLIAADQADGARLETPAPAALAMQRRANAFTGRRVGAYRLLEAIGAGGMGEIYRAVRDDDAYQAQVAIKLVWVGPGTSFIGERLRAERQILANLEHPNIARLLDGGTTDDGMPYLVMELVDGLPIGEYCRKHALGVTRRIELFIDVCAAVQYAHRHMVIHRDLKPGNILVTTEGVPKLLDFGIAKLLDPGTVPLAGDVTLAPVRLLTPDYASPEQLRGESVSTATDVYSLGVVLCELLTGALPGARADAVRVAPALDADLRNILGVALRLEPERRYATVAQLADDLRRHLAHLPVTARPDTLGYRASSFVRRHRFGVAATALAALALLVALASTAYQAQRARSALARATAESAAADAVTAYLESLFDAAAPERTGGKPIDVRSLIDQGQAGIGTRLAAQPRLRARMLAATGALYCRIGQGGPCRVNLERALALESAQPDADPLQRARIETQLARAYTDAGRAPDALALLAQAQPAFEAQRPQNAADLAALWYARGLALRANNQPQEEVRALEQAQGLESAAGAEQSAVAETLGALAIAYVDADRRDEALSAAKKRVALVRGAVGTDDVRYMDALSDYGEVAQVAGRFADAEPAFREAAAGYERYFGRGSEKTADAKLSLADVLSRRDRLADAIAAFRGAVDDYRAQGNLERTEYTGALGGLSIMLARAGDFRGSEQAAREAYDVGQRIPNRTPRDRLYTGYRWGHSLAFTAAARQCLALLEPELPGDATSLTVERTRGLRLLWRGDCYRELADYRHAGESYDQAIALYESLHQPQSIALNMAYEGKALLLEREGRFADAAPLLRRAIEGYLANQYLPDGPAVAGARIELAESLAQQGESAEARALLADSADIVTRELATAHPARLALERLRAHIKKPRSS